MGEVVSTRRSGTVSFRPHARLIRLLGDELISDEIMAVAELVKNGYDADASQVHITLDQVTGRQGGCISTRDNGDGMDLSTLLTIWMEPAQTPSAQVENAAGPHPPWRKRSRARCRR